MSLRFTEAEYQTLIAQRESRPLKVVPEDLKPAKTTGTRHGKHPGPNKTETEYGAMLKREFPGCTVTYEGITLKMANGHRYTPDWVVQTPGGWMLLVEVKARGKNGYRLPSYQRAKLAFDQCREEWRCFRFRWAEKQAGKWEVTNY